MSSLPDRPTRRPWGALCLLAAVGMAHLWLIGWRPVKPRPSIQAPPPRATVIRTTGPTPGKAAAPVVPAAATPSQRATRAQGPTLPSPAATPTPQAPSLLPHLPAPIALDFHWQQGPATLPAQLRWQIAADGFVLTLETTPEAPARPTRWLRSQGSLQAHGLAPVRHTVRRAPASERALTFIRNDADVTVAFSAHTYTRPAPADVQDALSWLPQWLARLSAGRAEQPIEVADVEGRVQPWQLTPDAADPWHWHTAARPDQTGVELWLSPEAPHWPLRMIVTPPWGAPWVLWRPAPQAGAEDE